MIVRDAVLADEHYTVAGAAPARGLPVQRAAVPPSTPAPMDRAEMSQPTVVPAPAAPVLSLAIVSAWLAEQDHAVLSELPQLAVELAAIREDARTAGFDSGRAEAHATAAAETERLHALLQGIIEAVRNECRRAQEALAQQCVEIVATAITNIAGPLLATREAAVGAVATALGKTKAAAELSVRVNPADLPLLQAQRAELLAVTGAASLQLLSDAQVRLGGCLVDSTAGTLDARLDVQLQGLFETLRAARAQPAAL